MKFIAVKKSEHTFLINLAAITVIAKSPSGIVTVTFMGDDEPLTLEKQEGEKLIAQVAMLR